VASRRRIYVAITKVITTTGGRTYRWVFLKIIMSEPGPYGIGSARKELI
jgi:hypothetical protein